MIGKARALLTGLGFGAGWMYFFDSQCGKRRRALVRDRCLATTHRTNEWFDKAVCDLQHRVEGTVAEAAGMFDRSVPSDEKLVERVRARLGHLATHPRLVDVDVCDGHVALSGHAVADEIGRIIMGVSAVRGVRSVDNQLDDQLGSNVSTGNHRRHVAPPIDVLRENWAPGTRLAMGALGGALMLNCMMRRSPTAILMGTLGCGLFVRATSNRDVGTLVQENARFALPSHDNAPSELEATRNS